MTTATCARQKSDTKVFGLHQLALGMGAKFEQSWRSYCTHLICAYSDTPKYKEVKESGFGFIVSPSWIVDSHKAGKKLPEKLYDIDNPTPVSHTNEGGNETEEEIESMVAKGLLKNDREDGPVAKPLSECAKLEREALDSEYIHF